MDFDLTNVLSSLPSANTKPTAKKPPSGRSQAQSGRGQGDMDLTDVLSSLPSANKPPSGPSASKPPSGPSANKPPPGPGRAAGTGASNRAGNSVFGSTAGSMVQPDARNAVTAEQNRPSFQNSTRFAQPQAPPIQQSYQNSTKFSQPAMPSQSNYQNSTRFAQPQATPTQNSYQNSTKFSQPAMPSPSYQNSTRFAQSQAPPTQAPPTVNSYQNSTHFPQPQALPTQPPPTQPQAPPSTQPSSQGTNTAPPTQTSQGHASTGSTNWSGLANQRGSDHGQPPSGVSSQQNPSGGRAGPPPAPVRSSSISRGSKPPSVPLSTDHRAPPTRTAPPPPLQQPNTPSDTPHLFSPDSASPLSGLGGLDIGDLTSSVFSTSSNSATSAPSSHNSALSGHTPNSEASLSHQGEELGKPSESHSRKLGPSVSIPPLSGGRGPRSQVERRQNSGDLSGAHILQGSTDSTPGTPTIRVESPTGEAGSPGWARVAL